jgi:PAS domain S-box-containing protein
MDDDRSLAARQRRALRLVREHLGVEAGYVLRRDGETDRIEAAVGNEAVVRGGMDVAHDSTYCRRTLTRDSPLALSDAPAQGWESDPAYESHGLACYLGTTVFAGGEPYGTVCFVSRDAREAAFTAEEEALVELLARLVGRALDAADRERSERKYESLLDAAPDAVVLVRAADGRVVEANDAAAALTGRDEAALTGASVPELVPPADRERLDLARVAAADGPRERYPDGTPYRVRRPDGTVVPVEVSAGRVALDDEPHVQLFVRDVTDRRERERDLRVRSRAVEAASVGITVADATEDGLPLVYANAEFERITGHDRETALGRNCRFLQGPGTDDETVAAVRTALSAREPLTTELLNYRADGTPFWNELTLAPVPDDDGTVTHFVGFQRDVTARVRRERLTEVLNRVLRHNLRNAMNVVGGYADDIADRAEGETAVLARRIGDAAADLTALGDTARTLGAAARDPADPAPRDVVADVAGVVADLRESFPETTFVVDAPATCRVVATDRLPLALRELGENAARHGGSTVRFRVAPEGDDVAVRVVDDGPGLDPVERRVLRAGRETALEHGQGLGLWLVNWVATAAGGEVRTAVDDGTTVTVALPAETDRGRDRPAALDPSG